MTTPNPIADLLMQAITPAGIAAYALYLLREEGRRNAANLRQLLQQYHDDTHRMADALDRLHQPTHPHKEA